MIVIEREPSPLRFYCPTQLVPNWIGQPGFDGEILCGRPDEHGLWKTTEKFLELYPSVEILNIPEPGHHTTYLHVPHPCVDTTMYLGLLQTITESTVAFTPLVVPEGAALEGMITYYFRSK